MKRIVVTSTRIQYLVMHNAMVREPHTSSDINLRIQNVESFSIITQYHKSQFILLSLSKDANMYTCITVTLLKHSFFRFIFMAVNIVRNT